MADDNERFYVTSPGEVARILRYLHKSKAIVTGHLDGGRQMLLTAIILVDAARNLVVLDHGPEPSINRLVTQSNKLFCTSRLDHVEIKFTLTGLGDALLEGQPVFRAELPKSLYYPQQREFFRLPLPRLQPPTCTVPVDPKAPLRLEVVDISIGGIGTLDRSQSGQITPDHTYANCVLDLPGHGRLNLILEVRSMVEITERNGDKALRIGFAFRHLDQTQSATVQRWINQKQVELRRTTPD